jgi:hypothetical protein
MSTFEAGMGRAAGCADSTGCDFPSSGLRSTLAVLDGGVALTHRSFPMLSQDPSDLGHP